ncbi:MAG: ATP-binding cassette domain-containing protein [Muribaculaceae bacterium]|nr:ATP-binding cassette domain-containing protein [Muribaculaceae bacterium]
MNTELIKAIDLTVEREGRVVLDHLNLTIYKGDFIALTGPNGGGKTTLTLALLGLLTPESGEVWRAPGLTIGYMPQTGQIDPRFPITVREVVAMGASKSASQKSIDQILRDASLLDLQNRGIGELSGGELRRTLLARALVGNPDVVVLDEPMNSLDTHSKAKVAEILRTLREKGVTVIIATHTSSVVKELATRHLRITGKIEECHHVIEQDCDMG